MEKRAIRTPIQSTDNRKIRGYAASYNVPAIMQDGMGRRFKEIIRPGAFTRSLTEQTDICMFRDHQPHLLLGRTKSGTLRVGEDERGLWFECDLPDTPEGRSVQEAIRRGDLDSCSFGFQTKADHWTKGEDMPTRELRDVTLYECSVVAIPAYPEGTSVDLRSFPMWDKVDATKTKAKAWLQKMKATTIDTGIVIKTPTGDQ